MSPCVHSRAIDIVTSEDVMVCVVHACGVPCLHIGESVTPIPLHATNGSMYGSLDYLARHQQIMRSWTRCTLRQRDLVIHHGTWRDRQKHRIGKCRYCWCGARYFKGSFIPDSVYAE